MTERVRPAVRRKGRYKTCPYDRKGRPVRSLNAAPDVPNLLGHDARVPSRGLHDPFHAGRIRRPDGPIRPDGRVLRDPADGGRIRRPDGPVGLDGRILRRRGGSRTRPGPGEGTSR